MCPPGHPEGDTPRPAHEGVPVAATEPWHAEHVRFAQVLDVLEGQLAVFHAGETPDYGLMVDAVNYLRDAGDQLHHRREDAAFARLVERDPALRLPVNRLLQEHRVIAAAGDDLSTLLNEVVDDTMVPREALEKAAALYLTYYRHHLKSEERDILPRAAKLLTRDDWSSVSAAVASVPDPLFDETPSAHYRELRAAVEAR